MATQTPATKSFWTLAYQPPRHVDPRRKPFTPPGPWFDATIVTSALVLGVGLWF